MLSDERIVITGVTGQIAFPMASFLASDNEVIGVARFTTEGSRERVAAAGIHPVACDLAAGDLSNVPDDATVLIHLAAYQAPGLDYDLALRNTAEATGFVLQH